MQHQVHGRDAQHGLIHLKARELRRGAVRTGIAGPLGVRHRGLVVSADVLGGRDEKARRAAGRVADKLAGFGVHHGHHHAADVLRRAELAVGARGRELREHVLVEVAQVANVVVELGKKPLDTLDGALEQGRLASGKAKGGGLHGAREGRAVAQALDKGKDELAHNAVHLGGGLVLKAAPAQVGTVDLSAVCVVVGGGKDMRLRGAKELLHALGLKFLLVKRTNEHEVGELADDLEGVGDAALPHLLPDGVDLTLGCSRNHRYSHRPSQLVCRASQIQRKHYKLAKTTPRYTRRGPGSNRYARSITQVWRLVLGS